MAKKPKGAVSVKDSSYFLIQVNQHKSSYNNEAIAARISEMIPNIQEIVITTVFMPIEVL